MGSDVSSQLTVLGPCPDPRTALACLGETTRRWFEHRFVTPTPAQRLAWPAVTAGANLLLCAPTGSGKTLAALLPIIDRILRHPGATGQVDCLYVAPLKALLNDARRNLETHLEDLCVGPDAGRRPCLGLRTGDTPSNVRRDLHRSPPRVLMTTPESLALMLSQPAVTSRFERLRWIVVDEVHALAPDKRGADLSVSLERLAALSAVDPQRVGLSATCSPASEAARFLAGVGRPCTIATVADAAPLEVVIEPSHGFRPSFTPAGASPGRPGLLERLRAEITSRPTTIVFTNVRSAAERLGWALRDHYPDLDGLIAVHHSALSAARRRDVEHRLKTGRLRAVITSTSLELGIDIGSVSGVVLVHPPGGVSRLVQRIGRSGHGPDQPRRGLILTAGPAELLEAAVTTAAGRAGMYEPIRVLSHPLDVLCQQLIGMVMERPGDLRESARPAVTADEMFTVVRRAYPYRDLSRADFDGCLDYLLGRRRDGGDWLPPRLRQDGEAFRIRDRKTALVVRRNLGTILAAEPRPIVTPKPGITDGGEPAADPRRAVTVIGQVDDGFADRLKPGDRFLLDGRCLEVRHTSDGQTGGLLVEEVLGQPLVPIWRGEGWPLSAELARRLTLLRARAADALRDGPAVLTALLAREYRLPRATAVTLAGYFLKQESVSEIPGPTGLLIETVPEGDGLDYYLHTPLNRLGNEAVAQAVTLRLARDHGRAATSVVADLGLMIAPTGPTPVGADVWRALLDPVRFIADLKDSLADSQMLRRQFRRVATTGLMILRQPLGGRRRVGGDTWAERRLFDRVRDADPECVIMRQAWREVLHYLCDVGPTVDWLESLARHPIRCRRLGRVSPFAAGWTQRDVGAADDVETPDESLERLHALLQGTVG